MCTYVRNYFCRVEAILKLDDSMKYLDISIALQLRSRIVFKSMAPKYKSIINKRKKLKFLLPFLLIVLTLSIKTSSAESAEILLEEGKINKSCTNECAVNENAVVHGKQDAKCQSQIDALFNRLDRITKDFQNKFSQQNDEISKLKEKVSKLEFGKSATSASFTDNDVVAQDQSLQMSSNKISRVINRRAAVTNSFPSDQQPMSCQDLSLIGHSLNGFYMIKRMKKDRPKIETVFCNFKSSTSQIEEKTIGFVDLKTSNVFFYVLKSITPKSLNVFKPKTGIITYEKERLNVGGGMDAKSGVFTAPKPGIYHFAFMGLKESSSFNELGLYMRHNGRNIGIGYCYLGGTVVGLQATLELKAKDRIDIYKFKGGNMASTLENSTHFTGTLLYENIHF